MRPDFAESLESEFANARFKRVQVVDGKIEVLGIWTDGFVMTISHRIQTGKDDAHRSQSSAGLTRHARPAL